MFFLTFTFFSYFGDGIDISEGGAALGEVRADGGVIWPNDHHKFLGPAAHNGLGPPLCRLFPPVCPPFSALTGGGQGGRELKKEEYLYIKKEEEYVSVFCFLFPPVCPPFSALAEGGQGGGELKK